MIVDSFINFKNVNLEESELPYETDYFDALGTCRIHREQHNPFNF